MNIYFILCLILIIIIGLLFAKYYYKLGLLRLSDNEIKSKDVNWTNRNIILNNIKK